MTNTARGEQEIIIGGVTLTLAMEYERLVEVENVVGVGVIALAGRFTHLVESDNTILAIAASPLTLQDVANCVWILSGKPHPVEYIGKILLQHGLKQAIDPLSDFFATAIAGDPVGEPVAGVQESPMEDSQ